MALLNSILHWFNSLSTHVHPGHDEAERVWQQYPLDYRKKRDAVQPIAYPFEKLSEEDRRVLRAKIADKVVAFISSELVVLEKTEWAEEERLAELQKLTKQPARINHTGIPRQEVHETMVMVNHQVFENAARDIHSEESKVRETYAILKHLHDILVAQLHYIALIKQNDDQQMEYAGQLQQLIYRDEGAVMSELQRIYTLDANGQPGAAEKIVEAIIHGEKLVPEEVSQEEQYLRIQKYQQALEDQRLEEARKLKAEVERKIRERNALRRTEDKDEAILRRILEQKDPYDFALLIYRDALKQLRISPDNTTAHERAEDIMEDEKKIKKLIKKRKPNLSKENIDYLAYIISVAFSRWYLY